jgi:hypothetical protein
LSHLRSSEVMWKTVQRQMRCGSFFAALRSFPQSFVKHSDGDGDRDGDGERASDKTVSELCFTLIVINKNMRTHLS